MKLVHAVPVLAVVAVAILAPPSATGAGPQSQSPRRTPLFFEDNRGQSDDQVRFLSRGSGYVLFLTPTEAVFRLHAPAPARPRGAGRRSPGAWHGREASSATAVVRMKLERANPAPAMVGRDELPARSSYFLGSDRTKWRTGIRHYARVEYRDVYPGVDLMYYGDAGQLEYDFVVSPGADPSAIGLSLEGARRIRLDGEGNLVVKTRAGDFVQRAPVVYQEGPGGRTVIPARYVRRGRREFGFEVSAYDRSRSLVIDPVLAYATYLGGAEYDDVSSIAVDAVGNVYVAGITYSADFPLAGSPSQDTHGGLEAFVTKLDSNSALLHSTYLGGGGEDLALGIAVDTFGNAYVAGATTSTDFPVAGGTFQGSSMGGFDAFVVKLDPGCALLYSTYLGGSQADHGLDVAVDIAGNAYVSGTTWSTDFPLAGTPSQADPPDLEARPDVFVSKLDRAGASLVYSTYLGGSRGEEGQGIAVDPLGNAYVTGYTTSPDFPTAGTPSQAAFGGGGADVFVTKLDPTSARVYSTYLGGSGFDQSYGDIAVDILGNAYVTGYTDSRNFPRAGWPSQRRLAGSYDAFVTKLNAHSKLVYSTYLGGSDLDVATDIAIDPLGNAYVTGYTASIDFPTAGGPFQAAKAAAFDTFVTKLDFRSALVYSTYLGGNGDDYGHGIAVQATGSAYVAGLTGSTDFPTSAHASQCEIAGGYDGYVAKIRAQIPLP